MVKHGEVAGGLTNGDRVFMKSGTFIVVDDIQPQA